MSQEQDLIREVPIAATARFVVFDELVKMVIDNTEKNLKDYYVTVNQHAEKSFQTSRYVAVAGFVLICFGMVAAMVSRGQGSTVSVLSGVAGVATEFISAIFFYMYNKTVQQMKEYHGSLLEVQNILLSLKLVADTDDSARKAHMLETLLQFLVGSKRAPAAPETGVVPAEPKPAALAKAAGQ